MPVKNPISILPIFICLVGGLAYADEAYPGAAASSRPIDGIRDNSFLVEEAYNQEPGIVQHIFTARFGRDEEGFERTRSWELSFTQEWPVFSQKHQFSYTVPYSFFNTTDDEADTVEKVSGVGDVLLTYRYQLLMDEGRSPAISPRFSLVLPTGNEDRDLGSGVVGYQFAIPISKTISDRMYLNFNAGLEFLPGVQAIQSNGFDSEEFNLVSFSLGGSAIYALTRDFHFLLEAIWDSGAGLTEREDMDGNGLLIIDKIYDQDIVIQPGFRMALNLPAGVQIVPGIGLPIGLSDDAIDYGVFFYLSIEHAFLPSAFPKE